MTVAGSGSWPCGWFRVLGFGFRALGHPMQLNPWSNTGTRSHETKDPETAHRVVGNLGFRVEGLAFRGLEFRVQGFRVWLNRSRLSEWCKEV